MPANPPHKAPSRSQTDYSAVLRDVRACKPHLTEASYRAILEAVKRDQAFREASRRRQAKYDRKKRQKPAV